MIIRIVVDLPAPLGPMIPKILPASARKSNLETALTVPNCFEIDLTSNIELPLISSIGYKKELETFN
jgi:hypothetical protein